MNINFTDTKPIFADEVALALKIKAIKGDKGDIEKEGNITLIFMDMMKKQALGEFVITKNTAKMLSKALSDNVSALDKQLSDKTLPKKPEIKFTADSSMYR